MLCSSGSSSSSRNSSGGGDVALGDWRTGVQAMGLLVSVGAVVEMTLMYNPRPRLGGGLEVHRGACLVMQACAATRDWRSVLESTRARLLAASPCLVMC